MLNVTGMQDAQVDALREVASIGAGHAATALSQLIDHRIMIKVPDFKVVHIDEIPGIIGDPESEVAAVLIHILGDLTGRTLLVLPKDSALHLSRILLRRQREAVMEFGELECSAIKEAGNILCAAYMNALSEFMGMMILPSVPALVIDSCASVLTTACGDLGEERDHVFSIETEFSKDNGEPIGGHFLLLPGIESLQVILRAIRLA